VKHADTNPLVTIVVPCYNQACFLSECLASVVRQTFERWVCVVVDDGSTVGDPGRVVDSVEDSRVRLIRHKGNRGLGAARNTGFRAAHTTFVLPLDADDRLARTFLSKTLTALRRKADAVCAYASFCVFGKRTGIMSWPAPGEQKIVCEQCIPGPGVLMKKSLWERVGGYCEGEPFRSHGNEDWDFWMSAFESGPCMAVQVPEPLYFYRTHSGSLMYTQVFLHSYATRQAMVKRHAALFERLGGRRSFLCQGCINSGTALFERGERGRALRLAARALVYNVRSFRSVLLMGKCVLPRDLVMLQRMLRRRVRKRSRG